MTRTARSSGCSAITGLESLGDLAAGLALDAQGNIYVTGASYRAATAQDYATVAYSPGGAKLWVKRYNGPVNGPDEAAGIRLDSQGHVYVTGTSWGNASAATEYTTVKYRASDGLFSWARRYFWPDSMFNQAMALAVDAQGRVAVTGATYNSTTRLDFLTVKYNALGERLWARTYDGAAHRYDYSYAVAMDGLGQVYVAGYTEISSNNRDYLTIKYNDSQQVWAKTYNGPANDYDYANAVAVDGQGNVYVTGSSDGAGNAIDCVTIKYGPGGGVAWIRRYSVPDQANRGKAICVDGQGNVYVTGESYAEASSYDYLTLKYSPAGQRLWVQRYNGPGNSQDIPKALTVDGDGNVYVTGKSWGSGTSSDYAIVKYDSAGVQLWVKRYNGPGNGWDGAVALALDGNGNLYVTGTSYGGLATGDDYATVKYTPEGGQLWVRRYDGAVP